MEDGDGDCSERPGERRLGRTYAIARLPNPIDLGITRCHGLLKCLLRLSQQGLSLGARRDLSDPRRDLRAGIFLDPHRGVVGLCGAARAWRRRSSRTYRAKALVAAEAALALLEAAVNAAAVALAAAEALVNSLCGPLPTTTPGAPGSGVLNGGLPATAIAMLLR
jgi:hypothetical protein